jgi:hypothetical protein
VTFCGPTFYPKKINTNNDTADPVTRYYFILRNYFFLCSSYVIRVRVLLDGVASGQLHMWKERKGCVLRKDGLIFRKSDFVLHFLPSMCNFG